MLLKLFPLALLASTVLADGASILEAIGKIANDTLQLNSTVASWSGDVLGTLPIIAVSTALLADINSGTQTAEASANLTMADTLDVAQATITLVADVQSALGTLIAAREKFIRLLLAPVIEIDLQLEKSATDKFSAAVISKVPATYQGFAEIIVAPVDIAFDYAIGNYSGVL